MAENGRRLDLNPILCTDTKNYVSEAKPRNVSELWNVVKDPCSVITAERYHKSVCYTDVKQF